MNIIRHIVKGFDVAYPKDAYRGEDSTSNIRGAAISDAEIKAWTNPKHPSKPELSLLDSYPVLPDIEALLAGCNYFVNKFITNPVAAGDSYDERLDTAILRPRNDPQAYSKYETKLAEWKASPNGKPEPLPEDDYDYYLPQEPTAVRGIKRKLNVNDPEKDDDELYTDEIADGSRVFKYSRLRTYETYTQTGDQENPYNDSVALALHDPENEVGPVPGTKERLDKAAYFYPVMQRMAVRPKRNLAAISMSQANDDERIDDINLRIVDMDEDAQAAVLEKQAELDPYLRVDAPAEVEAAA